jgi:hypothetical protein
MVCIFCTADCCVKNRRTWIQEDTGLSGSSFFVGNVFSGRRGASLSLSLGKAGQHIREHQQFQIKSPCVWIKDHKQTTQDEHSEETKLGFSNGEFETLQPLLTDKHDNNLLNFIVVPK